MVVLLEPVRWSPENLFMSSLQSFRRLLRTTQPLSDPILESSMLGDFVIHSARGARVVMKVFGQEAGEPPVAFRSLPHLVQDLMNKLRVGGSSLNELRSQGLFGQHALGHGRITGHGMSAGRDHDDPHDCQPCSKE